MGTSPEKGGGAMNGCSRWNGSRKTTEERKKGTSTLYCRIRNQTIRWISGRKLRGTGIRKEKKEDAKAGEKRTRREKQRRLLKNKIDRKERPKRIEVEVFRYLEN
jgi:hypothetical protein